MTVERITVSIDAGLAAAVRSAAETDDQNVSAWVAQAARRHLSSTGLRDVIAEWETLHGTVDLSDLHTARTLLSQ
jgi:hypothetical protein